MSLIQDNQLDVRIMKLDAEDIKDQREALSEAAWYELVEDCGKKLPIMVEGAFANYRKWVGDDVISHLEEMAAQ